MIKFNQPSLQPHTAPIVRPSPTQPTAAMSEFLAVKQAASFLHCSKSFLDKLRVQGGGPEFVRLGVRKILYRRADLEAWARQRRFQSTAEYPGPK
jgi:excisionase family DNA binding protein